MMTIHTFVWHLSETEGPWHVSGTAIRNGLLKCPISAVLEHRQHREGWNRDYQQNAVALGLSDADARTIAAAADANGTYDEGLRMELLTAVGLTGGAS